MEPYYQSPLRPEDREALIKLGTLMQEKVIPRVQALLAQSFYSAEEIEELKTLQKMIDTFAPVA